MESWKTDLHLKLCGISTPLFYISLLNGLWVVGSFCLRCCSYHGSNAKKNKRGDRGSSPEVINIIAKKPNMADGDEDEVFEECSEEEPSLLEIKEMLTTIQSSVIISL